jgi:hypothetical protein
VGIQGLFIRHFPDDPELAEYSRLSRLPARQKQPRALLQGRQMLENDVNEADARLLEDADRGLVGLAPLVEPVAPAGVQALHDPRRSPEILVKR